MTGINVEVYGGSIVAARLETAPAEIALRSRATVRHHGQMLLTRIKQNASGRPGPNVITGDYRRSWTMRIGRNSSIYTAWVGTNAPQGRRLEYGFVGVDSLGRHYNQPPFPHVEPALQVTAPEFARDIYDLLGDVL